MNNIQQLHPQYITDEDGNKISIILPIIEFESLIEDIEDLAAIAERKNESLISHKDLVKQLKHDGIV